MKYLTLFLSLSILVQVQIGQGQTPLKDLLQIPEMEQRDIIQNHLSFHGYTNYWHDLYHEWYRYGNLFKMQVPSVHKTILQSKLDVVEDIGIPGLLLQEGFVTRLLATEYQVLEHPSHEDLLEGLEKGNILVTVQASSALGQELVPFAETVFGWAQNLNSHQFNAKDFVPIHAFRLSGGDHDAFVILSDNQDEIKTFQNLLLSVQDNLSRYTMRKGYFGAGSLLKSVTIQPGHPLDIIGRGLNEGNSWFVFDGYMDFLAQEELANWAQEVDLPIYVDVGFNPIYGCDDYEGLQVQDLKTRDAWIDYAKSKNGFIFHPVYDPESENYEYDGYISHPGNKEQIDNENVPFIHKTGYLSDGLTSSMILFTENDGPIHKEMVWDAIMNRKAVAISEGARLMGPKEFRDVLNLLYLDREYLENYFHDQLDMEASVEDYHLQVRLVNYSAVPISGHLALEMNDDIQSEKLPDQILLEPGQERLILVPLHPTSDAMGRTNPVSVIFSTGAMEKRTLTKLDLPPVLSVHKLLYAGESLIEYPVTLHNYGQDKEIKVEVEVYRMESQDEPVFYLTQTFQVEPRTFHEETFQLNIPPGQYIVKTAAMGTEVQSQLGVEKAESQAYLYEVDLDSDGVPEYRMENDSVSITLLRTGARIIEYNIKSRENSNVLFKSWPEKTYNHKAPYRMLGYYPYGGFEDFLGQGSMETHKVYDARIIKDSGDYVQVLMEADFYGNRLEKIFTLYGGSPLVEVRYKLTFHNEEANVIGPQPILELGESHGTEDVFIVPVAEGLKEYRMRPEDYYGQAIHITEGWNAGYDTEEDISFIGAFPVDQPIFLHMWMNHPKNREAPHYYVEFQPWTPIVQKTNMYFTYYLWGAGENWKDSLEQMRRRNLITKFE